MLPSAARSLAAALCLLPLLALVAEPARAGDRPFLATVSAAAEEDDDKVWAIETTWQRLGAGRSLGLAAEYAFDPTNSLQLGWSAQRDREADARQKGIEIEFKHLFNRIGREGWGWGLSAELAAESRDAGGWRAQAWSVRLPLSIQVGDQGALVHLNLGLERPRDERRGVSVSAAYERPLPWRSTGFVELAREDGARLLHAGVRHWIRRERLAFDVSLLRVRGDGDRRGGVVLGLGWYDL